MEIGVKTQIAIQPCLKKEAFESELVKSWGILLDQIGKHALTDIIWGFVDTSPISFTIQIPSRLIGIYSIVKNYTNKQGKSYLAHFSIHGQYLCKANKKRTPISYLVYVNLKECKNMVEIQFDRIPLCKRISELFG